jgi:hypothetical protein
MSVDAAAIASRYAAREGCRFINFQQVGIEVFSMNIRVLVLEQRNVPPIAEFLLRFILEGIADVNSLSQILGIDKSIVESTLADLRRDELIELLGDSSKNDLRCTLTEKGKEAAKSLRQNVMQEITLPKVIYHGLLRRPISQGEQAKRQFLRPKEATELGLALVRAIPKRAPHPYEVDIDKLDRVVKSTFRRGPDEPVRDIVAVKSILKNVSTLYEPAVMLEYETADNRHERQVAFAVEGRELEEYEKAFSRARGLEVLAEIMTKRDEPVNERLKKMVPAKILQSLGKIDDIEDLTTQVEAARQKIVDVESELAQTDRSDTRQALEDARARLKQLEYERNSRKVKYLWTPEIQLKLWEALRTARERLLILSGYLSSDVVNAEFIDTLRDALRRGVKVWIGYGFDKGSQRGRETRKLPKWQDAEQALRKLKNEFPNQLDFRDIARSHEKRLICDNRFTFGGSFNLLSFTADNRGGGAVRHEGADLIEDPEFCEERWAHYLKLFFS